MNRFCVAVLVIVLAQVIHRTSSNPAELSPNQSKETPGLHEDSSQDESVRAGPSGGIRPPTLTTEKPTTTEPPASAESSGPLGGKLPQFPGVGGGGGEGGGGSPPPVGQGMRPMLILGAFQAIITPFEPSMLGSLIGGLGGGGGGGLPTFPPAQGSKR